MPILHLVMEICLSKDHFSRYQSHFPPKGCSNPISQHIFCPYHYPISNFLFVIPGPSNPYPIFTVIKYADPSSLQARNVSSSCNLQFPFHYVSFHSPSPLFAPATQAITNQKGCYFLKAAPLYYQLDQELARKWSSVILGQHGALLAQVTKIIIVLLTIFFFPRPKII